jgi:CDP-diglyceride synthetase
MFNWMGQFNTREKHFWFTHLFLGLSLLCSYQLPEVISQRMKLSPHVALVLIAADAFAAYIGSNYGKHKIYGSKTL